MPCLYSLYLSLLPYSNLFAKVNNLHEITKSKRSLAMNQSQIATSCQEARVKSMFPKPTLSIYPVSRNRNAGHIFDVFRCLLSTYQFGVFGNHFEYNYCSNILETIERDNVRLIIPSILFPIHQCDLASACSLSLRLSMNISQYIHKAKNKSIL